MVPAAVFYAYFVITPMAETVQAREATALAEMAHGAARAFLFHSAEAFWAELEVGTPAVEIKGRLALANVNSFRMAADVTRRLFDLIGANVIFEGSVLERLALDPQDIRQIRFSGNFDPHESPR